MLQAVNAKSKSTLTRWMAMVLATMHLLAFIAFAMLLHQSNEGQVILLWTLWTPVDFPISLLVPWGFDVLPSNGDLGGVTRRALPYVVHGILGTVWWYCLPFLFSWLFRKMPGSKKN